MTAAPETETDANGLTETERETLAKVEFATWAGQGERYDIEWADHLLPAVERIVAESVRVVEDEREHWKRVAGSVREQAEGQQARAESAEAAHEAEKAALMTLADEWDACDEHGNPLREGSLGEAADELRALLADSGRLDVLGLLPQVLEDHWFTVRDVKPGSRWPGCRCGERQAEDNHNARRHAEHVVDVLRALLAGGEAR